MGPSGSGKTTLLSILGLVLTPTEGEVLVGGRGMANATADDMAILRRDQVAFVFQQFNLLPSLSAVENVAVPLLLSGVRRSERLARALRALDLVGMADKRSAMPRLLSGGQQQRVAIARALVNDAPVLLCDEPTASLDGDTGRGILAMLREFARRDRAVAIVTHDERVLSIADRLVSDDERDRLMADARAQSAVAERLAARLAELERGARAEDREAARARARAARARLELAEASLARRQVIAPQAGTVPLSRLHAGEFYTPGAGALFVLGDLTRLQVRLEVDEIDAAVPVPGAACAIYSDAGVRLADGTIVRLAPKMGRWALALESPTARADVRVREVFVEVPATSMLVPNQRVWGHTPRAAARLAGGTGSRGGTAANAARRS